MTYESAILRFRPAPGIALLSCVKNSVLKTQLMSGSGSCGELTPRENQSSFSVDVLTNLMAPNGIVRSDEIESCRFTIADTTIYTALFVFGNISKVGGRRDRETYEDQYSRTWFTRPPKLRDQQLATA